MADVGLTTLETFAMLGDTIRTVKNTLKAIVADDNRFGDSVAKQELALTMEDLLHNAGTLRQSASQDGRGSFQGARNPG